MGGDRNVISSLSEYHGVMNLDLTGIHDFLSFIGIRDLYDIKSSSGLLPGKGCVILGASRSVWTCSCCLFISKTPLLIYMSTI